MLQLFRALFSRPASRTRRSADAGSRLGLECLSGGSFSRRNSRPSVRPEVEHLEERRVMSTSGVISAITDNAGQTSVFAIGTDQRVYELSPTQTHGSWQVLSDPGAGAFRQVSAGLDSSGQAICYALHASDSHVWRFDVPGMPGSYHEADLALPASEISGTRNNQVYAVYVNVPGAIVIYNGASNSWHGWGSPWGGVVQISTGIDRYGHDEVYILNGNQQVYQLSDAGGYSVLPMKASQISAGAGHNTNDVDLFYIDATNTDAYHYDGTTKLVALYCSQISAGLDNYGNDIVYTIDLYYHWLYRHDLSGNLNGQCESGNVTQISAAANDMVFAVTPNNNSIWVYDRDWIWNGYYGYVGSWSSYGWHALYGNSASPFYAPLAG
jgi:hypothetical protein